MAKTAKKPVAPVAQVLFERTDEQGNGFVITQTHASGGAVLVQNDWRKPVRLKKISKLSPGGFANPNWFRVPETDVVYL